MNEKTLDEIEKEATSGIFVYKGQIPHVILGQFTAHSIKNNERILKLCTALRKSWKQLGVARGAMEVAIETISTGQKVSGFKALSVHDDLIQALKQIEEIGNE